jgi:hypothetical protein
VAISKKQLARFTRRMDFLIREMKKKLAAESGIASNALFGNSAGRAEAPGTQPPL